MHSWSFDSLALVCVRKSASASAAGGREHRTLCVVGPSARQSPSRYGRGSGSCAKSQYNKVARQRGNEIADSMRLGSRILDVQLGQQRSPLPGQKAKYVKRCVTRLGKA
jgi:hypothetical protein